MPPQACRRLAGSFRTAYQSSHITASFSNSFALFAWFGTGKAKEKVVWKRAKLR
jgi:hypothetical protein